MQPRVFPIPTVTLRRKPLKDGRKSLYLDIYQSGHRSYEFLRLYLLPARQPGALPLNKQTLALANTIRAQRTIDSQRAAYGLASPAPSSSPLLMTIYKECIDIRATRGSAPSTIASWRTCAGHLINYGAADVTLSNLTPAWVDGFATHLRSAGLRPGSVWLMMSKLRCCLRHAERQGLISPNVRNSSSAVRCETRERVFLSLDEIRRLASTPCPDPSLRNAFIFSCLTGLRRSDIKQLTWDCVSHLGGLTRIAFRQRKTRRQEYLDVSPEALTFMGKPSNPADHIFHLPSDKALAHRLDEWTARAGIFRKVTFHSARHSFATLMLELGVDIYTLSKLLGHADVATTQVYARVLDSAKRRAVMLIPNIAPAPLPCGTL